jgi:hypothetical protein
MAWRMARARALKADSALWTVMSDLAHLTSPERISIPVVVVLATQDVYMQRAPRCHGKRIKYVREHLRREIADLFALDTQVSHAIRT